MTGHTPTPWLMQDGHGGYDLVRGRSSIATVYRKNDALFALRAVNAHEAMVEALEGAAVTLWQAGKNAEARKIDALLDRIAPDLNDRAALKLARGNQ